MVLNGVDIEVLDGKVADLETAGVEGPQVLLVHRVFRVSLVQPVLRVFKVLLVQLELIVQ